MEEVYLESSSASCSRLPLILTEDSSHSQGTKCSIQGNKNQDQWTWNLIGDLFNTSSHLTWQGITILSQKKADMPHDQIVQKKLHCCGGRRWGDSLKFSYFVICLVFTFISSLWGHGQESWDGNSRLSNCRVFEVLLLIDFVVKDIDFNQILCFVL